MCHSGDRHQRGEPCPSTARSRPRPRGSRSSRPTRTGTQPTRLLRTVIAQLVWIRAFEQHVLDLSGAGLIHGPAHSSIGQEGGAVGSVLALSSDDSVNGSHRGHHQFARQGAPPRRARRAWTRSRRRPTRSATCCCAPSPRSPASTAAGATAAAARCTCSGRRPGRWAPTPSSAAASPGGRLRLRPPALGHRRGLGHLLRRRRGQHRLHAGDDEPGRRVGAAGLLLHREQPLRRLHLRRGGDRRAAALRPGDGASTSRPGRSTGRTRSRPTSRCRRPSSTCGPDAARPSSRSTPIASSTRTAASRAAPSATARRRRRRPGVCATR